MIDDDKSDPKGYRLLNDRHLAHLIGAPEVEYMRYDYPTGDWVDVKMDEIVPMPPSSGYRIIYRAENIELEDCIGIEAEIGNLCQEVEDTDYEDLGDHTESEGFGVEKDGADDEE